jgi:hypothetical protein
VVELRSYSSQCYRYLVRLAAIDRGCPFEGAVEALEMSQIEETEEKMRRQYLSVVGQGERERAHGD